MLQSNTATSEKKVIVFSQKYDCGEDPIPAQAVVMNL